MSEIRQIQFFEAWAKEMGHRDSSLLRTRYVNARGLTSTSARQFWRA